MTEEKKKGPPDFVKRIIRGNQLKKQLAPSNENLIEGVARLYINGQTSFSTIAKILNTTPETVEAIVKKNAMKSKAEEVKEEILKEIFSSADLVDLAKQISKSGLTAIKKRFESIVPEELKMSEVASISRVVTEIDRIMRLEEGRPTDTVEHIKTDKARIIEIAHSVIEDPVFNPAAITYTQNVIERSEESEIKDENF